MPDKYDEVKQYLSNYYLNDVILFTAQQNFFQLPGIVSLCDLVISVETSIIHLASALKIPVVAIGGIDISTIYSVTRTGCQRVAVIRAASNAQKVSGLRKRILSLR